MSFPHPQSREDKYRNKDKPDEGGVVWDFLKGTINVTEYRNAEHEVDPAKNCSCGARLQHACCIG